MYRWRRMRQYRALLRGQGTSIVGLYWAGCIIDMSGFDFTTETTQHSINRAHRSTCWTESARCSTMRGFLRCTPENDLMLHAQYASRPFPVFAKLAVMLRNIPAMQFIFAKITALLCSDKRSDESLISKFLGETPDVTRTILAVLKAPRRLRNRRTEIERPV